MVPPPVTLTGMWLSASTADGLPLSPTLYSVLADLSRAGRQNHVLRIDRIYHIDRRETLGT